MPSRRRSGIYLALFVTVACGKPGAPSVLSWTSADKDAAIPESAVQGGHESDGTPIFICRASHQGGVHPGKVVGGRCNFAWGGQEVSVERYELLTSGDSAKK